MSALHFVVPILLSSFFLLLLIHLPSSTSTSSSPLPSSLSLPLPTPSAAASYVPSPCRFASLFPPAALLTNATLRAQFMMDVLYWEGHFLRPAPCSPFLTPSSYVGLSNATAMTLDGHRLSLETGLPIGDPHPFTASSKESLHVAMLALAVGTTAAAPLASLFVSPDAPGEAVAAAVAALRLKINAFDLFDCRFPGFGGFLPWVHVNGSVVSPQPGWETTVPGLDNGQLIWATVALVAQLEANHPTVLHTPLPSPDCAWRADAKLLTSPSTTLAQRWRAILERWRLNLLTVFYDGGGRFRDVTHIHNTSARAVARANYYTDPECDDDCYLDDPYEGELFTTFAFLYCTDWPDDRAALWVRKRAQLQLATLRLSSGAEVSVQRGFWFSAHEQWKYLFLPYRDVPINDRVFVLCEKARVAYSADRRIPGLFASTNGPVATDTANFPYDSDCGVPDIAIERITHDDVVTPYGAMNLMLLMHPPPSPSPSVNATTAVGLVWLASAIRHTRGQTCFGVTEASAVNGTMVAPLKTWDTSVTTALGLVGGVVDIVRAAMQKDGVYGAFVRVVEDEWTRVFGGNVTLKGEELDWALPTAQVPDAQPNWSSCTADHNTCQCSPEDYGRHPPKFGDTHEAALAKSRIYARRRAVRRQSRLCSQEEDEDSAKAD